MNTESIFKAVPPIRHDAGRLRDMTRHWQSGSSTFSRLFLANGILEHSAAVARHLEATGPHSDCIDEARLALETAHALLQSDPSVAECALNHLDPSQLESDLNRLPERYNRGEPFEDALEDEGFSLVDMLFSFEMILETLNDLDLKSQDHETRREDLNWAVAGCRVALADAMSNNPELTRLVEAYAAHAPGGSTQHPWPELFEHAPDLIFDAVISDEINQELDSIFDACVKEPQFRLAADADHLFVRDPAHHSLWLLMHSPHWDIELVQIDHYFHILYSGAGIDDLGEPIVKQGDVPLKTIRNVRSFKPSIAFKIDKIIEPTWDGTRLIIEIPGAMRPKTVNVSYKAGHEPR